MTQKENADGGQEFLHLLHVSLDLQTAPTIKQLYAILWHGGMSDRYQALRAVQSLVWIYIFYYILLL